MIDFGTPRLIDGLKALHQCRTQGTKLTQDPRLIQEPDSEEVIQTMFKLLMQTSKASLLPKMIPTLMMCNMKMSMSFSMLMFRSHLYVELYRIYLRELSVGDIDVGNETIHQ